ncbi:MAG: diguanylate cyclase [Candidatus Brocadiales bacterium]
MDKDSTRILLVEDDPEDVCLMREMLADVSDFLFEIRHADRLEAALECLAGGNIDVVISDLGLPDSQGLNTFLELNAHATGVPILVLTGTIDDEEIAIEAVKRGAQDYLVKQKVDGNLLVRSLRYAIERKRLEENIKRMAHHDALTNLPNRALLDDRLVVALAHARRNKEMLAVLYLDLDGFKAVNDTHGHTIGDQLLKDVAKRLTDLLRDEDTVARMGGDEFTLLLTEIKQKEDAAKVADKILNAMKEPLTLGTHTLNITTSVGIALYPSDGEDADTLLKNADTAMYKVKENGKNAYHFYSQP